MSWNQLLSIIKDAAAEREYWANTPPTACPQCGEPLRSGPPSDQDELYCPYDFWRFPRDWVRPPL